VNLNDGNNTILSSMYVTNEMKDKAVKNGKDIEANTSRGNRTQAQHEADCYEGALGEIAESIYQKVTALYDAVRRELANERDDGGSDVIKGENVKTITKWDNFVFVGDTRAEVYVVWRYDPFNGTIDRLGTFKREDIHDLPVGGRGIHVDEVIRRKTT